MTPRRRAARSDVARYAVAVGSVAAATALRLALDPVLGTRFPFAILFFAVLLSAWFGGSGPALLASACGGLAAAWFLLAPRGQLCLSEPESFGGLVLYLAVSLGIALLGGAMHRARRRAMREANDAARRREELRVTLHSIDDAVITTDVVGRVTSMNEVAVALTGWDAEAASGRPLGEVFRIVDEETGGPAPSPAARALAEGRIVGLVAGRPAPSPPKAGERRAARRRVLVVDDNHDAAESLALLLQLEGHETALAHDGEAAVEVAESFRPDLVLLDLGLPKLSGHEAARRIREKPWGRKMLLVALTGWGQEEDRRKSREVGFDDHLVKPVGKAALTELLTRDLETPSASA